MTKKQILKATTNFVKKSLENAEGGHDWNHIERVLNNALLIMKKEKANKMVVKLGVLLHDIADPKFHDGDEEKGPKIALAFLKEMDLDNSEIDQVLDIVRNISFKGGLGKTTKLSKELKIAQDADRLDAIGAIGIARAFNYGGFKGLKIYTPDEKPRKYKKTEEYRNSDSSTINHFYEKLLLLKDGMNTETGKKLAKSRHKYMHEFLKQFYSEVTGKR